MININQFFKQHEEDIMFMIFTMSIGFFCSILIVGFSSGASLSPHTPTSGGTSGGSVGSFGGEPIGRSLPAERHSENIENIVDILEHLHSDITFLKNNEKVLIRKLNYITTKHHLLEKMMKTFKHKTIVPPVEDKKKYIVLRRSARLMNMKKINYKE
jgi:hypothetical protein